VNEKKSFVYIGNWSFQGAASKGITIFEYLPESGDLKMIETICPDVAAGQLYLDAKNNILYSNDECGEQRGQIGGGGYVLAFRIDPETGKLTEMNRKASLSPEPSYLCLDRSGKYLTVCHCSDPFHVTRIVRDENGEFHNKVLFDDTGLVMFRINEDGSIGSVADVAVTQGSGGKDEHASRKVDPVSGHIQLVRVLSRLHSVVASPDGELLVVCDKGMDKVYTFKVDRGAGKLIHKFTWDAPEVACFPRYSAFHPEKPFVYVDNENHASVNTFRYDCETGILERMDCTYLLKEDPGLIDGKPVGCQDILMHPNGRMLYCTLSGLNTIVACRLDEMGKPTPVQWLHCRGNFPRGIALSPDERFLLCGNMVSGDVTIFAADADGLLTDTGKTIEAVSPSAIRFYQEEA